MLKAFDDKDSKGRKDREKKGIQDPYASDYLRIIQSRAYRRLAYKTQLLCPPDTPSMRTREEHTDDVLAISITISDALGLNTYLCQAIAAGHDIGHAPYCHLGEAVFSELNGQHKPFSHLEFGVVVAQDIEGLNLTYETLEGILMHSRKDGKIIPPSGKPQEYAVIMYADKLAFTFSDLDDAIRYSYLTEKDIPDSVRHIGPGKESRQFICTSALIEESIRKGFVSFSEGKIFQVFDGLRNFLYDTVYSKLDFSTHKEALRKAYDFIKNTPDFHAIDPIVVLALLTDKELQELESYLGATIKPDVERIKHFEVFEILNEIRWKKVDYANPDLSWSI